MSDEEKKINVSILPSECSLVAAALVLKAAQIGRQRNAISLGLIPSSSSYKGSYRPGCFYTCN